MKRRPRNKAIRPTKLAYAFGITNKDQLRSFTPMTSFLRYGLLTMNWLIIAFGELLLLTAGLVSPGHDKRSALSQLPWL